MTVEHHHPPSSVVTTSMDVCQSLSPVESSPEKLQPLGDIDRIDEIPLSPSKLHNNHNHHAAGGTAVETADLEAGDGSEAPVPDLDTPVRARVFALADDGNWEDLATGVFALENDHARGCQYFRVFNEKNQENCLFEAKIDSDKMISLQNDSVLSWKPEDGRDMALSFEYAACLTDVWHRICLFQRRPPEYEYFGGHVKIALPEVVDRNTIPVIESSLVLYSNFNDLRGPLAELVLEQGYIPQLLDQFRIAQKNEELDQQRIIFNVFRLLVLLNNRGIFDEVFSQGSAASVAQVFEADPGLGAVVDYHSFLEDSHKLKSVIPLNNANLEALIFQTIVLQYFKDVILPKHIDDEVYSSLTILNRSFLNEIAQTFDGNPEYYKQLAVLFTAENPTVWHEVLKFFKEFISICRASNMRQISFFKSPIFKEFLAFLQNIFTDESTTNLSAPLASEILLSLAQLELAQVQAWLTQQHQQQKLPLEKQMLRVIVKRILTDGNMGLRWHLVSTLRVLLDPPNSATPTTAQNIPSFDAFCDCFYSQHCLALISPFSGAEKRVREGRKLTEVEADLLFHLCELTSSFVLLHKYKIKYLLVRDHILTGVAGLMACHLAFVRLASLRLFRTLLSCKDEFYSRCMISAGLFDRVFEALEVCHRRNNLLRAALLDFFVALHAVPCRRLIDELVPKYRLQMEKYGVTHVVFLRLIQLYDSNYAIDGSSSQVEEKADVIMSTQESTSTGGSPLMLMDKWGTEGFKEEDYFSCTDDDILETVDPVEPEFPEAVLPPSPQKKGEEGDEEFGGALANSSNGSNGSSSASTTPSDPPQKKISLFGANIKNTLRSGFGLWKATPSSAATSTEGKTGDGGAATMDSPSKKSKHS